MVRELQQAVFSLSCSKIRVSEECETKLYKGLTSGHASVSQTMKYPRGKVLNLASLHMALTVILCELWWYHGILWHHCSDSLLLLGIQYIVFIQTQESFLRRKDSSWSSALVQMWILVECVCSISHHKAVILLWGLELAYVALKIFVEICNWRFQNSRYGS